MDKNVDAKILQRADDITEFMYKAFRDLNKITEEICVMKPDIKVDNEYRPFLLNLRTATKAIGLFEMRERYIEKEPESDKYKKPAQMIWEVEKLEGSNINYDHYGNVTVNEDHKVERIVKDSFASRA